MDRKCLYLDSMLKEYRSMYRALCRLTSYHEKLTTDGFDLTAEDKQEINDIVNKTESHFEKRVHNWIDKARV